MLGLRKFMFVAAPLLCVLLSWANAGASQIRDESDDEAFELNEQAVVCVNAHHYEEAVELLKKAIALRPNLSEAYNNLGVAYFKIGQVSAAIECLQQAIRLTPGMAMAHNNLGYVLSEVHRQKQAIDSYKQALLLKPDLAEAHLNLGVLYLQRGQRSLALEQYRELKSIHQDLAQRLFEIIYQDKIVKIGEQSRE